MTGHNGPGDPRKSSFAAWLADPVKNGGGVLMDFGCYMVLWSMGLKGMPESVYATAQHLKPEMFPNVEDHALIVLNYKDGMAILEASWDLPPAQRTRQRDLWDARQHRREHDPKGRQPRRRRGPRRTTGRRSAHRDATAARALRTDRLHG